MVSIHYKIITSTYDRPSSSYQCFYFSSMIKNKTDGYGYVNTYDNYSFDYESFGFYSDNDDDDFHFGSSKKFIDELDLINKISKQASIPSNTIVDIYFYSEIYVNISKNYTKANYDYECLSYSNDPPIFYAYVDLSRDPVFNNINKTQLDSERDKKYLENQVKDLNSTVNNLNNQNWEAKKKLNNIINKNEQMSSKNKELEKDIRNLKNQYTLLLFNFTWHIIDVYNNINQLLFLYLNLLKIKLIICNLQVHNRFLI